MEKLDKYRRLRISEEMDEDGIKDDEIPDAAFSKPDFKEEYKQKYSDIKLSIKEDW